MYWTKYSTGVLRGAASTDKFCWRSLIFFCSFFFLYIFSVSQYTSFSLSFLLTSLSFRRIVVSGFHYLRTCLSYSTLEQHCYDWHSALANPSLALFPIVIPQQHWAAMFSLTLSELPWQRAGKAWRSLKASSVKRALLASADDCTVSFISMKENKRQDWTGDKAAQLNTPERLTPHTVVGSTQFATGFCAVQSK